VQVASAGITAGGGSPASEGSVRAAARHGLDLSPHRSTQLTAEVLDAADLVLAMTPQHLDRVGMLAEPGRAQLLAAFSSGGDLVGPRGAVPDPFGGTDQEYEDTFNLLEALVERALDRLAPIVAP
jgi:protein-tyrosine-phosphatase